MPTAFEKLEKILRLEKSQGYEDKAVIGGFDTFARVWQGEARGESQGEAANQEVEEIAGLLASYGSAGHERRVEIVDDILGRIEDGPQPPSTPRRPPPVKPGSVASTSAPTPPAEAPEGSVEMPPPPAAEAAPPPARRATSGLEAPVNTLPGVSTAYTSRLQRLGIETVQDLLYH
ncbi:MAG: hypothetical protein P8129_07640, partial [Anaerolineae bacterium]